MKIKIDFSATLVYDGPDLDEDGIETYFDEAMQLLGIEHYQMDGWEIMEDEKPALLNGKETYELARLMGGTVMETLCGYDEIHGLGVREIAILRDRSKMVVSTSYYHENDTYLVIVREPE